MKEHLLLSKAYIYDIPKIEPILDDCTYDAIAGYWVVNQKNIPMILEKGRPKPSTKKCDVETGEDRK
ncbi:hypothetical protein [Paenibacillus sp. 22594]|uniref:hypothetical protein n=1 Tax=Paenibacillus sp. 22594 TaxID=3453947 RepID=UPI003F838AC2